MSAAGGAPFDEVAAQRAREQAGREAARAILDRLHVALVTEEFGPGRAAGPLADSLARIRAEVMDIRKGWNL